MRNIWRVAAAVCVLAFASEAFASARWQLRRLGGRDYLPVRQVADFYRMKVVPRGDRGVSLVSETRRVDLARGSREARIDGVKHWLSFPALYFAGGYYLSRMDLVKTLDPLMRPHRVGGLDVVHTVVLDPGHGAHDRGAVNRWGAEKNYNLDLCRRIRPHLQEAGLRVVITRSRDEFLPLEKRPAIADALEKKNPGTIFVSVHFNAAATRTSLATGYEVFSLTPRGAPNSHDAYLTRRSFSTAPGHRNDGANHLLATAIQHAKLGLVPMFDRGVKRARFAVLRHATVPAVLVEGGFMSNPSDARKIHSMEWRERLAEALAAGIIEYVELTKTGERPRLLAEYRAGLEGGGEADYQPLAGIGRLVRSRVPGAPGWRGLLISPLGEEVPPFRLEFEPPGWVQLEIWSQTGEDARFAANEAASAPGLGGEWPDPVGAWPGVTGWRTLLPRGPADEPFMLFAPPAGAPVDQL